MTASCHGCVRRRACENGRDVCGRNATYVCSLWLLRLPVWGCDTIGSAYASVGRGNCPRNFQKLVTRLKVLHDFHITSGLGEMHFNTGLVGFVWEKT